MTPVQLTIYRQSIWETLPAAVGWVNDFEGLFNNIEEDSLERKIAYFEKLTSIEIAIVTVDSNMVDKARFDDFAYRLLKKWGIGKISKSNGIVICVSRGYKKLYISTDFGINKFIDSHEKYKIINKYFLPYLEENDYFSAMDQGLDAIIERVNRRWVRYNK